MIAVITLTIHYDKMYRLAYCSVINYHSLEWCTVCCVCGCGCVGVCCGCGCVGVGVGVWVWVCVVCVVWVGVGVGVCMCMRTCLHSTVYVCYPMHTHHICLYAAHNRGDVTQNT